MSGDPSDFRFNNVHLVSVCWGPWSKGAKAKEGEKGAVSAGTQVTAGSDGGGERGPT